MSSTKHNSDANLVFMISERTMQIEYGDYAHQNGIQTLDASQCLCWLFGYVCLCAGMGGCQLVVCLYCCGSER